MTITFGHHLKNSYQPRDVLVTEVGVLSFEGVPTQWLIVVWPGLVVAAAAAAKIYE